MSASNILAMTRLGDALEAERLRRGISQEEASYELDISQPTFSRYIHGEPVPPARAPAMSRFLHIPEDEVRLMIAQTHEPANVYVSPRRRPLVERLDALERAIGDLSDALTELQRTPRPDGEQAPGGRKSSTR